MFQIEVPYHLATDFGLSAEVGWGLCVIRCQRALPGNSPWPKTLAPLPAFNPWLEAQTVPR